MNVVAANTSDASDNTMESPLQVLSASSSFFDYVKGMMECGVNDGDLGDAFEVTYDGKTDKILHSQRHQREQTKKRSSSSNKKRSHKNRKEVAKTHEYIHVDNMTDNEIAESWYTTEDIKNFRRQKKEERRMRKKRIQMERMMRKDGVQEYSDGESVYTSESDSDSYKKAVSWGNSFQNNSDSEASGSDVSDHEENAKSPRVAKPVLKKSQSDDKTLLIHGMAYRREKTAQRTTREQRRVAAMHKTFYHSGILFRGDQNRMERFFHLSNQTDDGEEISFYKEEENEQREAGQATVVVRQDFIDSKNKEESTAEAQAEPATILADLDLLDSKKEDSTVDAEKAPSSTESEVEPAPTPTESEVIILKKDRLSSEIKRDSNHSAGEEEKTEMHFPPSPTSPIANMELILSLQPTQQQQSRPQRNHQKHQGPFASMDSFSFPSYPALYDNASGHDDYFEYRMEEVLEDRQRSSELPELTKKYQTLRKKLMVVVKSVKTYQKTITQMEQARSACLDECSNLIQEPSTGRVVRPGTFQFAVEKSPITKLKEFAEMEQKNRAKEFQEYVLDYASHWEDVVTGRVDKELKNVKKLQQSRSHYVKKVESLRKKSTALDNKGKDIPADLLIKLERNETKLKDALEAHEWNASRLCALIEQVTQYGWKDLLPLVSNLMKYEFNRSGGELAMYGKFPLVIDSFQQPFRQCEEEGNISDLD
ncbi:MAG: hypothetical protein SGBAC_004460 [Bacillariaceae sp.]